MAEAVVREEMSEGYAHDSLALPSNNIGHGNSVSPRDKPSYLPVEHDAYDPRRTEIGDDKKKPLSPSKYSHYQGEMDELRGNYFDKSSFNTVFDEPTTDQVTDGKDGTDYDARNSLSESEETTIRLSGPHSGVSKQSLSPVATQQMSVSPESSPCINQSPSGHMNKYSQQGFQDPSESLASHKEKRLSSTETSGLVKGTTTSDHKSPSSRRTSTSPHRSQHKEISLKRRSRSPVCKMESSSSHRRGHYGRCRSRSPNVRDHQRSPRRRYSPRRRSPGGYHPHLHSPRRRSPGGYHSRHRSPRRKHWSPPPNRRTGLGKPGNNLFVAGFSFLTTERDLERKFSRFGRVRDIRIVRDRRSGDSRGFGFLSLEKDEEADAAIRALDETEWDGRIILVEKSKST